MGSAAGGGVSGGHSPTASMPRIRTELGMFGAPLVPPLRNFLPSPARPLPDSTQCGSPALHIQRARGRSLEIP